MASGGDDQSKYTPDEQSVRDAAYMRRALELAVGAAVAGEVPVGAVLVDPDTDRVIAEGANGPIALVDATAHAEIVALRAGARAIENYRLTGLTLYVTLEPCTMCAGAISFARIGRVVFGASDAKGGAVENGVRFFDQTTCHWKPEVTGGVLEEKCSEVLKTFFRERRS